MRAVAKELGLGFASNEFIVGHAGQEVIKRPAGPPDQQPTRTKGKVAPNKIRCPHFRSELDLWSCSLSSRVGVDLRSCWPKQIVPASLLPSHCLGRIRFELM